MDKYILPYKKMELYLARKEERKNIIMPEITILSNTCIGGRIYHDYGAKFLTPTIDSYMEPKDFIKFCTNLEYYLDYELEYCPEYKTFSNFIPAKLKDIYILFGHTNMTFEQAKENWNRRKKRIIFDNIVCICTDRIVRGEKPELLQCDEQTILDYSNIPYRKVLITTNNTLTADYIEYLPSYKDNGMCPEATRPSLNKKNKYIIEEDGFCIDNFIFNV